MFVLPPSFAPDPDDVAFFVEKRRRAAQDAAAHYFEWEGDKVDGKSYVDRGRTFCGDFRKRRTGRDVPTVLCADCLDRMRDVIAEHDATCTRGASCPDSTNIRRALAASVEH